MGMNDNIAHDAIQRLLNLELADESAAPWSTELFRVLVQHPPFKHALIHRFAGLLNTRFSTDKVLSMIDQKQQTIAPEIEEHLARWRRPESVNAWYANIETIRAFATFRSNMH